MILGGQFELEIRGQFKLERGGQFRLEEGGQLAADFPTIRRNLSSFRNEIN